MSEQQKARLVLVAGPGFSHLVPAFELAKRLTHRDSRLLATILVINPPSSSASDSSMIKSLFSNEHSIDLVNLPEADPPSPSFVKLPEVYLTQIVVNHIPAVKDALKTLMSSSSSSVPTVGLVLDFLCTSMIPVGRQLGLPCHLYVTTGAAFLGLMLNLPTRNAAELLESGNSDLTIPCFANPVPVHVLPTPLFTKEGYASGKKHADSFAMVDGIIVNTFEELEPHAIKSFAAGKNPPVYAVGPVINFDNRTQPDQKEYNSIMGWLDAQPELSVVFVSFGSMAGIGATEQIKEIATALDKSGFRYLWCLRNLPEDVGGDEGKMFPKGFNKSGLVKVCGWAPQVEVMNHKAVGGFVSHCGWNSTLESLWHGVPIVTWPLFAEQQLNAFTLVKELGLAVELKLDYRFKKGGGSELVTSDEIIKAVKKLMGGDCTVRNKVKKMREISKTTVMDGGSSFNNIGRFIDNLMKKRIN